MKKYYVWLVEAAYLLFIYLLSRLPLRDYDIWFHLKSGELFVKQGHLQFTEIFAHTVQGKDWIPYEWLFQVTVYLISQINIDLIPYFIAIFVVLTQFMFLRILNYIFNIKLPIRIILSFMFFVAGYDFNTARPHVLAYSFVMVTLFLILAKIYKGKNWIYFTPLLTLIWTNLHSTSFLMWGLQLAFAGIIGFQWFINRFLLKGRADIFSLKVVGELLILAIINCVCTILPPLGLLDYKLLWTFFQQRDFLGKFIAEWAPTTDILGYNVTGFVLYSTLFIVSLISFCVISFRNKRWLNNLVAVPFIIMAIMGFSAVRNLYLGTMGIMLLLAWNLQYLKALPQKKWQLQAVVAAAIVITFLNAYLLNLKYKGVRYSRLYYPTISVEFINKYLHGKLFNDYTYGGYVLYNVYPHLQVFIDGRADVYICCRVMKDYLDLALKKHLPDKEYNEFLDSLWNEYDISVAVLPASKHNILRRIATLLNNDPNWALVFWDDSSQVFVRRDGKNKAIIEQMEMKYATPYLRNVYRDGKRDLALQEYERMDKIVKTARTSNAIGFILSQKGQFQEAADRFTEAMNLDPTFESPYMSLAELAVKDSQLDVAINLYNQALQLAPDRGLIYIRLGEITLQKTGDTNKAREIWQKGVNETIDEEAKKKLKELVSRE